MGHILRLWRCWRDISSRGRSLLLLLLLLKGVWLLGLQLLLELALLLPLKLLLVLLLVLLLLLIPGAQLLEPRGRRVAVS
jgi:hypothetical protein